MPKILITTSSFDKTIEPLQTLRGQGYEILLNPFKRKLSEAEITTLFEDNPEIEGLIAGTEPLNANVLKTAKNLKTIARCGAGMDSVDIKAAKNLGISVTNTPDAPTDAVAELTIGLILDTLRQISVQDRGIRSGHWTRPKGGLLGERVLGLIGYGRIGRRVAEIAQGFNTTVLVYDPYMKPGHGLHSVKSFLKSVGQDGKAGHLPDLLKNPPLPVVKPKGENAHSSIIQLDTLQELYAMADIISLHVPYTKDNHHLINQAAFDTMKESAILINASRGGLVDENALAATLKNKGLAGAALDVFEEEPYNGALKDLDTVVLTAHTGSYAVEARQKQERQAAENLLDALNASKTEAA